MTRIRHMYIGTDDLDARGGAQRLDIIGLWLFPPY
jgi:hypothetical protein